MPPLPELPFCTGVLDLSHSRTALPYTSILINNTEEFSCLMYFARTRLMSIRD